MASTELGPYFCENQHHALLHYVLGGGRGNPFAPEQPMIRDGFALEFGVGSGASLNCIARYLPVIGFDSFEGLPEDWRPGFPKGSFAYDFQEILARTPEHCLLKPGPFEETVPPFFEHTEGMRAISLIHFDADLYSSTKLVLDHLPMEHLVRSKTVLVFDEYQGYSGSELHEEKAWLEYAARTGIQWDVLGHGEQSWGIKIK